MIVPLEPTWMDHVLVGLLAAFALYAILRGQPQMKRMQFDTALRIQMYWSNGLLLFVAGAITVAVWRGGGRSLGDLGLRLGTFGGGALALIVLFIAWYAAEAWYRLSGVRLKKTIEKMQRDTPFMPTDRRELRHFLILATAAGINEEIIFRGFLISYLIGWTGTSEIGLAVAVTLPAIGFAVAHLYQGWRIVTWIAGMSILFGAIFLLTQSLLILIALHIVMDAIGGLMVVRILPPKKPEDENVQSTNAAESIPA